MNNIYLKRHGKGKKIRGHNIQLWLLISIYVCSMWRPSKSPMPVIYQHIFVFPLVNSHNLFSFRTTFSGRALRLNPFRHKMIIKPYHKIAFKGFLIPLKNAWKTSPNCRFATINFKINFGHDRRRGGSAVSLPPPRYFLLETARSQGMPKAEEAEAGASRETVAKQGGWALFRVWNN